MTSLILLDLPHPSFCAIDLASFTTAPRFRGIKNIPPGIHFCYFSPTSDHPADPSNTESRIIDLDGQSSNPSSLHFRTGFFFAASPSKPYIIRKWCSKTETLLSESDIPDIDLDNIKKNLTGIHHEHLSPYEKLQVPEEKLLAWNLLSSVLNQSQATLTRILGPSWSCESTRETTWESEELDEAIRSKTEATGSRPIFGPEKPSDDKSEQAKDVLDYTRIDLKRTWPPNAMGRERTVWARDRSWVITDIFRRLSPEYHVKPPQLGNGGNAESRATANSTAESLAGDLPPSESTMDGQAALLAEFVLSFVLTVLLANYSSTVQFKHLLEVSLTAGEAIKSHTRYFARLTGVIGGVLKAVKLVIGDNVDADDDDDDGEETYGVPIEEAVLEEFVSGGDAWLIKLLRGFSRELRDVDEAQDMKALAKLKKEFTKLQRVCKQFGWYLDDQYVRKGMIDLPAEEGGGKLEVELEDMEGEDERGEFAPVIVEL
ncbi:hypothetical protein DRE_06788 [Drechslerella stenobrocha 248]|uniref:Uncharacterized protein n=1 Tax=Drechslerella stenobrocha 248 TaxID=1043628 RepID=W7I6K0_9PEZI|nr:hypothetical protein DRE_06788 [Drechslerella stenobrocha 248]